MQRLQFPDCWVRGSRSDGSLWTGRRWPQRGNSIAGEAGELAVGVIPQIFLEIRDRVALLDRLPEDDLSIWPGCRRDWWRRRRWRWLGRRGGCRWGPGDA